MYKRISLALAVIAFIIVFLIRYDTVRPRYEEGQQVKISGVLQEEPQIYGDKQRINLANLQFYAQRFPEYHYGDKVEVVGTVQKKERGWGLKVKSASEVSANNANHFLLDFRQKVLDTFGNTLPPKESSLIKGLILGTKSSLDPEFYSALKKTGTIHVVVASGSNVSLFAGAIIFMMTPYLSKRKTLLVALLVVWCYVFLIGGQPPIVRAALFASIGFVGQIFGKEINVIKVLGLVGAIMLLVNPPWIFDVGFQLSFAATVSLLLFSTYFTKITEKLKKIKIPEIMRKDLATTLAAQVLVTPILFFNFGQISFMSPIVNMLVLWTIPPVMMVGSILGILGTLGNYGELGAQALAWLVYPLLWWFISIIEMFSSL
jgi:ComEC/Rec2-related protein